MDLAELINVIKSSELFDAEWYVKKYPDVSYLRMEPVEHYAKFGALLGRDPGPTFSTSSYLLANPEVAESGLNPLYHYLKKGSPLLPPPVAPIPAETVQTILRDDHTVPKKRVLIADFRYPRFDSSAGELATFGIIKMFAELGYDVTFVPKESTQFDAPYIKALTSLGVRCRQGIRYDTFKAVVAEEARDIGIAYIFRPDVAELCFPCIRSVNLDAFIFYHAPDVYFRRETAQCIVEENSNASGEYSQLLERMRNEIHWAGAADHVVCVSDEDANALRSAFADPRFYTSDLQPPEVSTYPLLYLASPSVLPDFASTQNICFIGSSEHTPNRDAIRWFLDEIWPAVHALHPELQFHIIGKTDSHEKAYYEQFANVVVTGWVESIEEVLAGFRASIAPLRFGAGIKGKVGLSVISGVPCVATSVAAEDMGFIVGEEILVADDKEGFVTNISAIVGDEALWAGLSTRGARRARELYSEDASFRRFIRILNNVGALDATMYTEFINRMAASEHHFEFPVLYESRQCDISIVVPAFNKPELTKACLVSVYFSVLPSERITFEVIYADDCSERGTIPEIESICRNVTVTKTSQNSGFVQNCNKGASVAKGRYLVLLNNDAVVLPGWLNALYEAISSVDGCFVAGSKLLYANAKIQEAGAGLWSDARSCSVGRGVDGTGLDRYLEEYNFIREVDFVSFASVIVDKNFWDIKGGLSQEYGFGYYDDSDFCLEARAAGGMAIYAPESEVVHNESASFSSRKCKSVAIAKRQNSIFFRNKWAEYLIQECLPYEAPSWDPMYSESICKANAAKHHIKLASYGSVEKRHILYFSPFPSHPASHGNQTTIQKFGKFLQSEGHAIHFVLLQSHMYSEKDLLEMKEQWDSFDIIKVDHFPSCNGQDVRFDGWYVPGLGEKIALLCIRHNIDTVICSYVFQSRLLDYVPSYILKILDTHDKFTDRYEILDRLGRPREFFSCTQQEEGLYLSRADVVLARRDEETDYFDSISTAKVYTVPHIEDRAYLSKGQRRLKKVGMVASCNLINLDIVISFLAELVRQKPGEWGFTVSVAGEVKTLLDMNDAAQARLASHPSIDFIGFVDDIADFYSDVDMIVCPIMSGTGINVKTVQALAYAMPILATQHASKGVETNFDNHQFDDISSLVSFLLTTDFSATLLKQYSDQSMVVYDHFIDTGHNNFRLALALDQSGLRHGIGQVKNANLDNLYAKSFESVRQINMRKRKLARDYEIKCLVNNVSDFGPAHIELHLPLPNVQPNGHIGCWFKFSQPLNIKGEFFLRVDDADFQMHKSSDDLLTTSLPPVFFEKPRELPLFIEIRYDWEQGTHNNDNAQPVGVVRIC